LSCIPARLAYLFFFWFEIKSAMRFQGYFFVVLLLGLVMTVRAEEQWFTGTLTLKSQTKLKGELSIHVDHNVVVFRSGEELMVFPAHKVQSVTVYDEVLERHRNFTSIQTSVGAATLHQLYEIVLDGSIAIVKRDKIAWYSVHVEVPDQDYFVWSENQLLPIYQFKRKELPKLVRNSGGDLKSFIRDKKLKPGRLNDMMEIINHYNKLRLSDVHLATRK
jgi:hypothetical protein